LALRKQSCKPTRDALLPKAGKRICRKGVTLKRTIVLYLFVVCALTSFAKQPENDRFVRVIDRLVEAMNASDYSGIVRLYDRRMTIAFPLNKTIIFFKNVEFQYGKVSRIDTPHVQAIDHAICVMYLERGVQDLTLYINDQGKIKGLLFITHTVSEPQAAPKSKTEPSQAFTQATNQLPAVETKNDSVQTKESESESVQAMESKPDLVQTMALGGDSAKTLESKPDSVKILELKPDSVVLPPWQHTININVNVMQDSYTNWAEGGENTLAYSLSLEGESAYRFNAIDWTNTYKIAYGRMKLGSQGTQKTDDELRFESVLMYKIGTYINPYISASLRTQLTEGVDLDENGNIIPVSNFFDPAYLTQAAGVNYQPTPEINTRLGIGIREIVTNKFGVQRFEADNFTRQGIEVETYKNFVKVNGGLVSVTDVVLTLMENIELNARLEMFAPFKLLSQVVVRSDNTLSAMVNEFISVNLNLQLIQDVSIQARTQIRQSLSIGLFYKLL
jgi:hypothetical protein